MSEAVGSFVFPPPPAMSLPVVGQAARFPVRRVYCVGRNYLDHIREMREADERDPPFFFQKPTDAVVEDGAVIAYAAHTDDLQHEVELVVAIGRPGRNISVGSALNHVFGYAVGIDLTRRDRHREALAGGRPWEVGKSFDQSAPCGAVRPVAALGHPATGRITLGVNGATRQTGDLSQMIWNCPEIIVNLSAQYALEAGDLIFTGTPAGVGPVGPGDRLEAEVEAVGRLAVSIGPRATA